MRMSSSGHKNVKFTAEEMAYDPPDTSDPNRWVPVGRGAAAIFGKPQRARTVTLEADIARVFPDSASVNKALRKLIEAMPAPARRRKTA